MRTPNHAPPVENDGPSIVDIEDVRRSLYLNTAPAPHCSPSHGRIDQRLKHKFTLSGHRCRPITPKRVAEVSIDLPATRRPSREDEQTTGKPPMNSEGE